MLFTVEEVLNVTRGKLLKGSPQEEFYKSIIDSREALGGELFIPLEGEKENGHKYIMHALEAGACGALIERKYMSDFPEDKFPPGKNIIVVEEALKSLQALAGYYRDKFDIPVIAVTGSNGKTTTKDFIASILSRRYNVLKTKGNLNNHIGLPLTLFGLTKNHDLAVLELGMSGFEEIAGLARLCKPQVGVITNIGEAHIEFLGDKEGIAKAKGELLMVMEEQLGERSKAILNSDDLFLQQMGERFKGKSFFFGTAEAAHLRIKDFYLDGEGYSFRVSLPEHKEENFWIPLPGKHNVFNAAAALSVGINCSVNLQEIKEGLRTPSFSEMRLEKSLIGNRHLVINDAYNANPTSVKYALNVLEELGREHTKVAVLGGMFELGEASKKEHLNIGYFSAQLEIDYLVTVGEPADLIAKGAEQKGFPAGKIFVAQDYLEALKYLFTLCDSHSFLYILIKGSRGMAMERIAEGLKEKYG